MAALIISARSTMIYWCNMVEKSPHMLTDEDLSNFIGMWIMSREQLPEFPKMRSGMIKKMTYAVMVVADQFRPLTLSAKSAIKREATRVGGKIFRSRLVVIRKAHAYTIQEVKPLCALLWSDVRYMYKQAGVVLAINYATGARTCETLNLCWEDIK